MTPKQIPNQNFQTGQNYRFFLPKIRETEYFVQSCNVPGLNGGTTPLVTPFKIVDIPGDELNYEDLSVTFKVEEGMRNWYEIYTWMIGIYLPTRFIDHIKLFKGLDRNIDGDLFPTFIQNVKKGNITTGASLFLEDSQNKPLIELEFVDVFPVGLTQLDLSYVENDVTFLTATVTFKYSHYFVKPLHIY